MADAGLADRYVAVGSPDLDGKVAFFRDLDAFCVPARFVEPKGIYALEARFESPRGRFNVHSDFLVESGDR